MEINSSGALISGGISGLIAFGAAFLVERKLSALVEGKVQRYLLLAGCISVALGLMSSLNELFSFMILGLQVREDKIFSSLLIYIFILPGMVGLVIWLLKLMAKKNITSNLGNQAVASTTDLIETRSQIPNSGISTKNILLIGTFVVLAVLASQFSAFFDSFNKEKIFKTTECQQCDANGLCKSVDFITGFKVDPHDVIIMWHIDGKDYFRSAITKTGNCAIIKEKNFAFSCHDYEDLGYGNFSSKQHEFDGNGRFSLADQLVVRSGGPIPGYSMKFSCKVR
jgi:hypothetical protein